MVYLLHLDKRFYHAGHYIGFIERPETLEKRLEVHRRGQGARFLRAVSLAGISWRVARTWEGGSRTFERHLKKSWHGPRLCPECNAGALRIAATGKE